MVNLEQSGSRIPNAWSVIFKFSLIEIFYLAKTENRTNKISNIPLTIALSKGTIFAKKMLIFCKKKCWHQQH